MILKTTRKTIANLRQLSGTDFGAFGFLSINKPGEIDPISVTELYNSYISKPRTDSPCPLLLEREHGGCLAYDERHNTTPLELVLVVEIPSLLNLSWDKMEGSKNFESLEGFESFSNFLDSIQTLSNLTTAGSTAPD